MVLQDKENKGVEVQLLAHKPLALPKHITITTANVIVGEAAADKCAHFGHRRGYIWYNSLGTEIFLKYRDGVIVRLPSMPLYDDSAEKLCCRVHTHAANHAGQISHEVKYDNGFDIEENPPAYRAASGKRVYTKKEYTTAQRITYNLERSFRNTTRHETDLTLEYVFTLVALRGINGVYVSDLDVVITTSAEMCERVVHPYSHNGLKMRNMTLPIKNQLSTNVYIVDNACSIGKRYGAVLGRVYEIPVIVDPEQRDGVYVARPATDAEKHMEHVAHIEWYSFKDAIDKYIIYGDREGIDLYEQHLKAAKLSAEINALNQKPLLDQKDIDAKRADIDARRADSDKRLAEAAKQDLRRTIIDWAKIGAGFITLVLGFVLKAKFANSSS